MSLGNRNRSFGLPGARGQRIVRQLTKEINGELVKIKIRSKTYQTITVGWNYTVISKDTEVTGFTNVLTIEEAIVSASEKWMRRLNE